MRLLLVLILICAPGICVAQSAIEKELLSLELQSIVSQGLDANTMFSRISGLCRARYGETDINSTCGVTHLRALEELKFVLQQNVFLKEGERNLKGVILSSCKQLYYMGDMHMLMECLRIGDRASPEAGLKIPQRSLY